MVNLEIFKRFDVSSLENHVRFTWKCHTLLIGEWVRWWLEHSDFADKDSLATIEEPATQDTRADLGFAVKGKEGYRVIGVAEVENTPKKCSVKIKNLREYESHSLYKDDLQFVLLSATLNQKKTRDRIIDEMRKSSKDSKILWVLFIFRTMMVDKVSRISKIKGAPAIHVFKAGKSFIPLK